MKQRLSARLILIDPKGRILLFRFVYRTGSLAGKSFWATPGGALDPSESFEDAARRELREETGFEVDDVGQVVARREFILPMPDGMDVIADERFFIVHVGGAEISHERWTPLEREVMADHRWWSVEELVGTTETVFPPNLAEMMINAQSRPAQGSVPVK